MGTERERTVIVREGKQDNKLSRYVVKPIQRLASWEIKDNKKERVSA